MARCTIRHTVRNLYKGGQKKRETPRGRFRVAFSVRTKKVGSGRAAPAGRRGAFGYTLDMYGSTWGKQDIRSASKQPYSTWRRCQSHNAVWLSRIRAAYVAMYSYGVSPVPLYIGLSFEWCYGKGADRMPNDPPATVTGGAGLFISGFVERVTPAVAMTAQGYKFAIERRCHCASSVLGST